MIPHQRILMGYMRFQARSQHAIQVVNARLDISVSVHLQLHLGAEEERHKKPPLEPNNIAYLPSLVYIRVVLELLLFKEGVEPFKLFQYSANA